MKKEIKYAIIVFLIWIISPLILAGLVFFVKSSALNDKFLADLLVPGIVLSAITYFVSFIKNKEIKRGLLFAIIGGLIWVSPAVYFLPASAFYSILSPSLKFLVVFLPSIIVSALFFFIGKNKEPTKEEFDELYTRKNVYSLK